MPISERNSTALRQRKLDPDLLELYGIADSSRPGFDIEIPYMLDGKVVNRKYRNVMKRNTGDNFSQDTGGKQIFWNLEAITDPELEGEPLLICEGELDALSAIQAGFRRSVSVPNGAPHESGQGGERYRYLDDAPLSAINEIILCVDDDQPGINLRDDLALRLGRSRCKFIKEYPIGCKDLNDALRAHDVRGVVASLGRAQWMAAPGVYDIDDLPMEPVCDPHQVGIPGLEKHYNARLGDMCVVTGIPSHGKSTAVINIACHMAKAYGWPVAMASFEMRLRNDLVPALKTWYGRYPYWRQTPDEITKAHEWIKNSFAFLRPAEDDDPTLLWMLEAMRTAVIRRGCKLVIIDPWNELEHQRARDESLTEYVGSAIKRLKRFAVKQRVHLIVVAHPAKMQRNKDGTVPMPTLYDISDSSHWYNKPDVGVIVHRDGDDTIIKVAKSRYHDQIGEPGEVRVKFVRDRYAYEAVDAVPAAHWQDGAA